ncbi:MAG: terminase large subunit [Clostridiaceae bacterium]|nr:terminase large subunit [Clostridiaceae bacterium]
MNPILEYWAWIEANPKKVNRKIKLMIKKLVSDITDVTSDVIYDQAKANHAISFCERYCRNIKGKDAGKLVVLDLWEKAFIASIFGIVYKDTGLRRTKRAVLIIAKKNGKSFLSAAIGLYMQIADGEGGPEVYAAATKRDQAKIIWNVAKAMIRKDKHLKKVTRSLVGEIITDFNDGVFKPLASDADTLDGHDIHCALMDEIQQWRHGYDLYDILYRGMDNRLQPLALLTSTAGTIREDLYDMIYEEASNIIDGYEKPNGFEDEQSIFFIYELDERDEWKNFENLIKANPGLGTIRNEASLKTEWNRAKNNPNMYLKMFLTKNCNIRETAQESWLSLEDIQNDLTHSIDELRPSYVFVGADLSSTTDLTCVTWLYQKAGSDRIYVEQMYFIPEDILEKKIEQDYVPYDKWVDQGWVTLLPGNKIDQESVWEWCYEYMEEKNIIPLASGFDTWGAELLMKRFGEYYGKRTVEAVRQGVQTLSQPMKALGADLQADRISYNKNPVLEWCIANTVIIKDRNGNIQPHKGKSTLKRIDGLASLLDAYVVFLRHYDDYQSMI